MYLASITCKRNILYHCLVTGLLVNVCDHKVKESIANPGAHAHNILSRNHRYTSENVDLVYCPCNCAVSHGAQIGGLVGFWQPYRQKQTQNKCVHDLCAPCGVLRALSSHSDCNRCRWHMYLPNHGYFDYGKNLKTPIWAPCRDKNGAGFGISLVYLWQKHNNSN